MARKPKDRRTRTVLIAENASLADQMMANQENFAAQQKSYRASIGSFMDRIAAMERGARVRDLDNVEAAATRDRLERRLSDSDRDLMQTRAVAMALVAMTGADHSPREFAQVLANMLAKLNHDPVLLDGVARGIIADGYAAAVQHNLKPPVKRETYPFLDALTQAMKSSRHGGDGGADPLGIFDDLLGGVRSNLPPSEAIAEMLAQLPTVVLEELRRMPCRDADCRLHSQLRKLADAKG
ncbi:MAG: hypothetical protein Q8R35_01955 [bacterium]|nr:hypothetical protein [bacterium]